VRTSCDILFRAIDEHEGGHDIDILKRIEDDHGIQRGMMGGLKATEGDSDERRETFRRFALEYRAHAAAEEHAFYAELMKHPDSTDQSRHSVQEHAEGMELLEKLEAMDMSSPEWLKTFKRLADENEHHMEEEEEEVFELARRVLSEERRVALEKTFEARKREERGEG